LGKNAIDRELKKLRDAIGRHPALSFGKRPRAKPSEDSDGATGSHTPNVGGPDEVANRVLVEAGTESGREPSDIVELRSYLSQFLKQTGHSVGAEDEGSFQFRLLHFRRARIISLSSSGKNPHLPVLFPK